MLIILDNFAHNYEIEQLTRMFDSNTKVVFSKRKEQNCNSGVLYIRQNRNRVLVAFYHSGVLYKRFVRATDDKSKIQMEVCRIAYGFYKKAFNKTLPWGLLTGVRPVRLMRNLCKQGLTLTQVEEKFKKDYLVSGQKIELCKSIYLLQQPIVEKVKPNHYSLYISIPFCPSKCSYCSFISTPSHNAQKLMEEYVQRLCQEIEYTAHLYTKAGAKLKTIYIGGGTPTAVSANQLKRIMKTVKNNFDLRDIEEYTVESGRPDCTDREKLQIIKDFGATRVSVNPQTFSDNVLQAIGRKHTNKDFLNCYNTAREIGFKSINTDLIAGLPKDDVAGFKNSVEGCIALKAENVTVHTLTLKRASDIVTKGQENRYENAEQMLEHTKLLTAAGYRPYYMYRQKSTLQSLENVGFSLPSHESLYNIYIMEEIQTIISCGAGGVSKVVGAAGEIERVYNYKYPAEYVKDFNNILARKDKVLKIWQHYGFQKDL